MHSHYMTTIRVLTGCGVLLLAQSIQAAGFYISEVGAPGSLGTAGVLNPVNTSSADSSWTNPAGMTGLKQDEILTGLQVVVPKIEFDSSVAEAGGKDGGNAGNVVAIPDELHIEDMLWEPDQMPDGQQWTQLRLVHESFLANGMLWKKQPLPEITQQLDSMGIGIAVFDPCANRPAKGDYLSVMQDNIANLRQAYTN